MSGNIRISESKLPSFLLLITPRDMINHLKTNYSHYAVKP